jgi:hypothetical protein
VTSDWISYALIDDITDAFGPLIQSIEYEVDTIDELVLIIKGAEQSDMLRRIGTCRKKVMGLLRLMGNKADVVKGLAKRCNENWKVAPTSDIVGCCHSVSPLSSELLSCRVFIFPISRYATVTSALLTQILMSMRPGPPHHYDTKPESLREDSLAVSL